LTAGQPVQQIHGGKGGVIGAALGVSGVLDQVLDKIDSLGLLLGTCVLVYLQSMPVIGWMVVG